MKTLALMLTLFAPFAMAQVPMGVPQNPSVSELPKGAVPPKYVFGVIVCGKAIIWTVTNDGRIFRFDAAHKPPPGDMNLWLSWIAHAQNNNIVNMGCPGQTEL